VNGQTEIGKASYSTVCCLLLTTPCSFQCGVVNVFILPTAV